MKRIIIALSAFLIIILFLSCNKIISGFYGFQDPISGDNQVAEYHLTTFDPFYPPKAPYLFKKTYDSSGRVLKEIVFSFTDDIIASSLPAYTFNLLVEKKGRVVFLLKKEVGKNSQPDTAFRLYLSPEGRPDSCIGNTGFIPDYSGPPAESEYFYYRDNRFFAVKDELSYDNFKTHFGSTDTMYYDRSGNPLSFRGNSYEYDYTRKAALQFYCDDYTGGDDLFYLLEYLDYFPEITSTVNIRTRTFTVDYPGGLAESGHQFDSKGRLISYNFTGPVTITWNNK